MQRKILLIDIGSSSVKIYLLSPGKKLQTIKQQSILFKDGFNPETGISETTKKTLFDLLSEIKKHYPGVAMHVYATAIFRKFSPNAREAFIKEFAKKIGAPLTIIDHETENVYLEAALIGKYHSDLPIMFINIGGGSTEVVIVRNGETVERVNIDAGVGTINNEFPLLNQPFPEVPLSKVMEFITEKLPPIKTSVSTTFYTGGELRYMQLVGYHLQKNTLFTDVDHPLVIILADFAKKNKEVFEKISLEDLEKLMPENPLWMHGARACSAFAQMFCETYGIKTIIPSNSNLMNGIVRRDFE